MFQLTNSSEGYLACLNRFLRPHVIVQSLPTVRGRRCSKLSKHRRGSEKLVPPKTASESEIAAHNTQYVYNKDYAVGDYVTVQHRRFGMIQPCIQLIGMIEGFDQNGRSLTPTFKDT